MSRDIQEFRARVLVIRAAKSATGARWRFADKILHSSTHMIPVRERHHASIIEFENFSSVNAKTRCSTPVVINSSTCAFTFQPGAEGPCIEQGKEELLEPLALVESGLHPQVRGARQNAFCERQDALRRVLRALTRVTFVGSVAERREMPSDCRCERSAKWSHLSRAKRVRLHTTTKCTRPLFSQ